MRTDRSLGGTVLVTGAGTGIGRACALMLAREGLHVTAAGRTRETLEEVASHAPNIDVAVLDVTDEASVERAVVAANPIGAVVNNAGVSVMGPLEGVPLEEWRRQFETNVFGVATVCRAVLPQMRQRRRGRIVNMGSVAGRLAAPFMGTYAASKHALEGMTDALRREVRGRGIDVVLVRPGFVDTGFGGQEQASLAQNRHEAYAEAHDRFARWHRESGHAASPSPDVVAEAVLRALTDTAPKDRYAAPPKARRQIAMRNLLPTRIVDRVVAKTTGIEP